MKIYILFKSASILLITTLLTNCQNKENDLYSYDEYYADVLVAEESITDVIDYYGGDPDDPQLPDDVIGATDEVLEATDPRELADILAQGNQVALEEVSDKPRYLFALGRIAYFLGYHNKALNWLEIAAENGSSAANAHLGYIALYETGDIAEAKKRLQMAKDGSFVGEKFETAYKDCNFVPDEIGFNQKELISAFYNEDWSTLQASNETSLYIAKVHNTLWNNDILWLAEEPKILMELDAELSKSTTGILEVLLSGFLGRDKVDAFLSSSVQDAKRLALLYNTNPQAFKKIYAGMVKYHKKYNQ